MFDFSTLQQLFGGGNGQGLLGQYGQQPYGGQQQPQMGQQQGGMPGYGTNPYAMGIPTQPQATAPYQQYSPYTQGGSPYTQTGWTPSFQDYFSPFQDLRQEWQDKNNADYTAAQQPQGPSNPNQGQVAWSGGNPLDPFYTGSQNSGAIDWITQEEADKRQARLDMVNYWGGYGGISGLR